jgi:LacI family transcriptional regulator
MFNTRSPNGRVFEAILSIARKMGFVSPLLYSELNLIRARSIGLMIPNLNNAFYTDILREIEAVVVKSGFSLFVCPTYQSVDKETHLINDLVQRKIGGLIVLSTSTLCSKELKELSSFMRVVSLQSDIKGVDNISVTDEQGMFEATEHLVNLGHTRIAFMGYDNNISNLNNRLIGFRSAHKKYNLPIDDSLIFKEHVTSSGYLTAKALLQSKNRPTAIQCINDHLAMGVYMAASELSIKIPQQISVSGFDNTMISRLMTPNLTTVAQPSAEMGETAARLIIKRIIGDERKNPQTITLPTKLIIRDSTAIACK